MGEAEDVADVQRPGRRRRRGVDGVDAGSRPPSGAGEAVEPHSSQTRAHLSSSPSRAGLSGTCAAPGVVVMTAPSICAAPRPPEVRLVPELVPRRAAPSVPGAPGGERRTWAVPFDRAATGLAAGRARDPRARLRRQPLQRAAAALPLARGLHVGRGRPALRALHRRDRPRLPRRGPALGSLRPQAAARRRRGARLPRVPRARRGRRIGRGARRRAVRLRRERGRSRWSSAAAG